MITKLASEGSKFVVDAVSAEEYSLQIPNLPLRGVYLFRGSLVFQLHHLDSIDRTPWGLVAAIHSIF